MENRVSMPTIFLDESGHTGEDLLNADQPCLVLASLCLSETDCQRLKAAFFGEFAAAELKFVRVASGRRYQDGLIEFLEELAHLDVVKGAICNKRYALVAKLVDLLIEPVAVTTGFDLYQEGQNQALADLLYLGAPLFVGEASWENVLRTFQGATRTRSEETHAEFVAALDDCQSVVADFQPYLDILRMGALNVDPAELPPMAHLELTMSSALVLMSRWREELTGEIELIHDHSKPMAKERAIWEALMSPALPPRVTGYDRRTLTFPIGLSRTLADDSRNWVGLQLADMVAGALARFGRSVVQQPDGATGFDSRLRAVIGSNLEAFIVNAVWPNDPVGRKVEPTDYAESNSPLDYLRDVYRRL